MPQQAPRKHFPTPKFVFTISAPVVVSVDSTDVKTAWKDHLIALSERNDSTPSTISAKKKKTRVKVQSLLIKMLNRLLREEIVPYEAISVIFGRYSFYVRILVSSTAIPIIMLRCEHIGLGNVVGLCHVSPLETCLVPPATAGPTAQVSAVPFEAVDSKSQQSPSAWASISEDKTVTTGIQSLSTEGTEEEDSLDEVSSEEGFQDETMGGPTKSTTSSIPFLSQEKAEKLNENIAKARKEWRDTASRVRVAQVVEEVSAGAAFTLDYIAFVICAACVAAVGLGTDSSTSVIASMLISPIMGPVMGFTFGTTVHQKSLIVSSFRNEIYSLLICIIIGMLFGILATVTDVPNRRDWPSEEMLSRGDIIGLVSGILIALPSGVAVSLSTLGKNSSGMVGVAISLSLLPPAVNAGMCWVYSLMLKSDKYNRNEGDTTNYAARGTISFSLTVVNIICIWIAGVFTFWLKEVAPVKQKNAFWTNDIAVYRERQDSPEGADLEVINDGIKATLELQEVAAANGDIYKEDIGTDTMEQETPTARRRHTVAFRRRSMADNATNDALFLSNRVLLERTVGDDDFSGTFSDKINLYGDAKNKKAKDSLFGNANKFGGIEEAGEALFDSDLTGGAR